MQGIVPQGYGFSRIVRHSTIVGRRQSQCPANPPLTDVPSVLPQMAMGWVRPGLAILPFSRDKNDVKTEPLAGPSGRVGSLHL